jgi:hypothetical protein
MIEKDCIMRMIAQLTAVLTKVISSRQAKRYDDAAELIQNAYGELFGLSGEVLETLDAGTLAGLLGEREKIKALAILLKEDGDLWRAQSDDATARHRYKKSLTLFQRLLPTDDPDLLRAITVLKSNLT